MLFVAVFALIAYSHFQYLNDRRDARIEDMERVNQTVAAVFDGFTRDLESFSLSTAITLGEARTTIDQSVDPAALQRIDEYLGHLAESHGQLTAVFITDTAGGVVYDDDGNSFGRDLSSRPYIQALQEGNSDYWSGGFPGLDSGKTTVTYSRAVIDPDGVTTGYLVMAFQADQLAERLPASVADAGHISIIDQSGRPFFRLPVDGGLPVDADLSAWPALATARANGTALVKDQAMELSPEDRYGALAPMDNVDWVVGYTLPASEVEGASTGQFYRDVMGLGLIILAAFATMWVFATRTVRPLGRLTEIASAISRGELAQDPGDVETGGNAEVLQLADAMSQMRRSIQQREEQLESQTHVMEVLEHFGESLASELDLDRAIEALVEAGVDLVDSHAVQFLHREHIADREDMAVGGPQPSLALSEDDPLVREVLTGKIVDIADRDAEPGEAARTGSGTPRARSVVGVPIRSRTNEVEGAFFLLSADAEAFTAYNRRLALGLARWASITLENARLYRQSQELVSTLAASNEAKNDFLGIVSHELRTPITTIYGGTLLLRLRRESLPEQAFNDMIVSISEEAERLHHLVQDLLAIARTELNTEPQPVVIAEILKTLITDFSSTHKRDIHTDVEPGLPPALADSTYVRQVITNLVSNADKYTPFDLPIEISAMEQDGEIFVRVKDNGSGVSEADLPQIFDSFYRTTDAVERASGSGLGLTVCKRLIESLGGRIWAQNRPEGGLEVGFTLQALDGNDEEEDSEESAEIADRRDGAAPHVSETVS